MEIFSKGIIYWVKAFLNSDTWYAQQWDSEKKRVILHMQHSNTKKKKSWQNSINMSFCLFLFFGEKSVLQCLVVHWIDVESTIS